ncbi:HTH-type transcriptional regulator MurR [Pseudovibrio sp. Ad13]|uniref:MurR/RpiR family transcriptional regulator n=1 Tax=unclassified Pseudovibrio TaxID=2627060 RepID=UPI0007AED60F|nr:MULTISPECIES: MurR/RpiR family transcriptional regulator [unclassified Pseudovibrio]KZK81573.1 HTH-type transcriptional regulator MurR [Pseudovibrio sp. Ad13]KZL02067.1 HTH-type transcriptional regulator MurR [Pseudovibrio sp. Ad5]
MTRSYQETVDQLTKAYPNLSKQLKKSAAYVLEYPSDVATLSMRQVAARADVPPPTMNRLAKSLEFGTYNALRDVYRGGFEDFSSNYPSRAGELQATHGTSDIEASLQSFKSAALGNLKHLFDTVDRDHLQQIVSSLATARNVVVVGMHASHSLANYLHYVASMCFRNWRLINRKNGEIADQVEYINADDVVVAISLNPCAADTVLVAKRAYEVGATVVGITDTRTSPLATYSTDLLLTPVQSPHFFESYVATAALLEMILGLLVADSGQVVIDNITRLERCRNELGEYWPDQ